MSAIIKALENLGTCNCDDQARFRACLATITTATDAEVAAAYSEILGPMEPDVDPRAELRDVARLVRAGRSSW